jgi:SAM-dependent methyltransferase
MNTEGCPACSSLHIETVEQVYTPELIEHYAVGWQLNITPYVQGVREILLKRCLDCDLRFFDPPCTGDASFYEQLQQSDWYYQDEKPEYGFARNYIGQDCELLEVGCGKGAFRNVLHESARYTGLEFNDEAISKARSCGLNIYKQSVQEHVASVLKRYDVVCSFQVLEHIPEPAEFVRGCRAALKPGGTLILAIPAEDSFLADSPNAVLNMPPHHVLRWSDQSLRNLSIREGFTILELWHEPIAPYHRDWYTSVLARHWFVSNGLLERRLIDRGFRVKLVRALLRRKMLRDICASREALRYRFFDRGHTVVLVASAPNCQ